MRNFAHVSVAKRFAFLALMALTASTLAANGDLDTNFHTGLGFSTKAFDLGGNNADYIVSALLQPNGDIVLVGFAVTDAASDTVIALTRLLPDGTLDSSFGAGGTTIVPLNAGIYSSSMKPLVWGAALDAQGSIYVTGYTNDYAGYSGDVGFVAHFLVDGQLDNAFGSNGFYIATNNIFQALGVDSAGKPVAVGFHVYGGGQQLLAVRLTATGQMDPSFNGGNAFIDTIGTGGPLILDRVGAVTFDGAGRIYLGAAQQVNSNSRSPAVVRLSANGTIDTSCGNAGVISTNFGGMAILPASVLFRDSHHGIWVGTADSTLFAYDFDASTCSASSSPGPLVSAAKGGYSAVASDGAVYVSYTFTTTPSASQILALHDGLAYTGLPYTIYSSQQSLGEGIVLSAGRPLQAIRQSVSGANFDFAVARFQNDRIFFANFDADAPN